MRALDHPRCDDADDSRVPIRGIKDDPPGRVEVHRIESRAGLIEDPPVHRLPLLVQLLALPRDAVGHGLALGHQERHAAQRVAEPTKGVESRRQRVAHAPCGERFAVEARRADQRAEAEVRGLLQLPEAESREDAVLATERCYVGDGGERDEVEHPVHGRLVPSETPGDGEGQLVRDAHRCEILVHRRAVRPSRVDHREGPRERTAREVMVADDQVHAHRPQRVRRRMGGRPAVAGEHHARTETLRRCHAGRPEVVAVAHPVGDEGLDHAAEATERRRHQGGRADAVDVVVAVDHHRLAAAHRVGEPVRRAREVGHRLGRLDLLEGGAQEPLRLLHGDDPARREQLTDRQGHRGLSCALPIRLQRGGERLGDPGRSRRRGEPARRRAGTTHTAWYIRTPQTSQSSIAVPDIISWRRCMGIAVSHAPQERELSATTTWTRFLLRMRS